MIRRTGLVRGVAACLAVLAALGYQPTTTRAEGAKGQDPVARAVAAGFADPAAPQHLLVRERFVRWAVLADGLQPRSYDPAPGMAGIEGTQALADGSLGAAASAGIVEFSDYAGTGDFGGEQPKPRQEAILIAVRMLGLGPQAVELAGPATPLPFADGPSIPDWARASGRRPCGRTSSAATRPGGCGRRSP